MNFFVGMFVGALLIGALEFTVGYLLLNNDELNDSSAKDFLKLRQAVSSLYYSGVWHCDRPVNEARLWEDVRDAANFYPGRGPRPLK